LPRDFSFNITGRCFSGFFYLIIHTSFGSYTHFFKSIRFRCLQFVLPKLLSSLLSLQTSQNSCIINEVPFNSIERAHLPWERDKVGAGFHLPTPVGSTFISLQKGGE
jgi:hypothetical protein